MKSWSCTIWVQLKKSGMQDPTEWVKIFLTFYPKSNWDDAISMSCFERAFQLVQLKSETYHHKKARGIYGQKQPLKNNVFQIKK